jgi:hypothetical protein
METTVAFQSKRRGSVGDLMAQKSGKQKYPGVRGKLVDFIGHKFAEGRLYIHVRFQDKTEICWEVECVLTLREADLSDWTGGNFKRIKSFARDEKDEEL